MRTDVEALQDVDGAVTFGNPSRRKSRFLKLPVDVAREDVRALRAGLAPASENIKALSMKTGLLARFQIPTKEPTIARSAVDQRAAMAVRHGEATVTVTGTEAVTFTVAVPLLSAPPL